MYELYNESLDFLKGEIDFKPVTGIVLGTGLGDLVNNIEVHAKIPYSRIPHFPVSTVEGHHGALIFGYLNNRPVVAMQGRFHYYEGYSMKEVTYPIRIMKLLGIKDIFISNASGGVNPDFEVGDLMLIRDHINFFPESPLRGPNHDEFGPRFTDMSEAYDKGLMDIAIQEANKINLPLHLGVYLGNPGPSFETPAEYTHYRIIGADAIGMSTVPEVIIARHMGLRVCAISVITNVAVPGRFHKTSHIDVQLAAVKAQADLGRLLMGIIGRL